MPTTTKPSKDAELADQLAAALVLILHRPTVTEDDRMQILALLQDGICEDCGQLDEGTRCSCRAHR